MKKYLSFLLLFIIKQVMGQTPGLSNVVPPSPNAASLAQYADVPVSNYTGVPNISIPIFNVKSGKIELPVSASYHSSGIRVAEEASWIGLGWTLNTGGVITRQTRGLDDFKEQGGYIRSQLPPATAENKPDWTDPSKPLPNDLNKDSYINNYYTNIQNEFLDPEPDIFYYNFFQYSGKLVFEKQSGNIVKAVSVDQNNLIFQYDITSKIWTVTDGNGWKYYLGSTSLNAVETTTSYSHSSPDPIVSGNDRISEYDPDIFDSTWYLTKIVNPQGDHIDFTYDNLGKTISQINRSEQISDWMDSKDILNGQYAYRYVKTPSRKRMYSAGQQVTNGVYLKRIDFNNGYVEFDTEDRTDLRSFSTADPKAKRLKSTKMFDLSGKLIKKYDFNYSYFTSAPSSVGTPVIDNEERKIRLRLDSMQESSLNQNGQAIENPPYVFSYNQTLLPEKTSYSLDYWGYSNGRNNNSIVDYEFRNFTLQDRIKLTESVSGTSTQMLVPFYEGIGYTNMFFTGADREVNPDALQAAILQKIQYPTGAVVDFKYEANDYFNEDEVLYEDQPVSESAKILGNSSTKTSEKIITLDKLTMVQLYFGIYNIMANSITPQMTASLEDLNGNQLIAAAPANTNSGTFNSYLTVFLPAGSYKLKVNNENSPFPAVNMEVTIRYVKKTVTNKKKGAGLRILSITTSDQGRFLRKKIYSYEKNSISTGLLISPYHFFYNNEIMTNGYSEGIYKSPSVLLFQQINKYLVRCSESTVPFGNSAQGNVIGYNEVRVFDADSVSNFSGSSKYLYRNIKEIPVQAFIPGMPNIINLNNGQLLKEQQLNKNSEVVWERSIEYALENTRKKVKGVKIFSTDVTTGEAANVSIGFYDVFSEWWTVKKDSVKIYDVNGQNPVTTITDYKYGNSFHKNITETQSTGSNGQVIKTIKKYPSDLSSGLDQTLNSTILSMINSNVINPVLESETKVDDVLVQSVITNYDVIERIENPSSFNMYLPKNIKMLKGGTVYDELLQYILYDNNGSILQEQKKNGAPVSYIWGYRNELPIAKIENANYNDIPENLINAAKTASDSGNETQLLTALSAIRNTPELGDAMVSTYTYIPLIGVSSSTDAKGITSYYEYDTFGRLMLVKDQNFNVLQRYCYGYRGQQVDCSLNDPYGPVFKSMARSGSFLKNDCVAGSAGTSVIYSQAAGVSSSQISQEDADLEGLHKFNVDGQAYANSSGKCIFKNTVQSRLIARTNCALGGVPESIIYMVPAGIYESEVSQADADAKAQHEIDANGEASANNTAKCIFKNTAQSRLIERNNCAAGGTPESITYNVPAGVYDSDISQMAADAKAQNEIDVNGQVFANNNARCIFRNTVQSRSISRTNCVSGGTPENVIYTVAAGSYESDVSQAAADAKAQNEIDVNGETYANTNARCKFLNTVQSRSIVRTNCAAGGTPESIVYIVPAGRYDSYASQADADARGQHEIDINGEAYANTNARCRFLNTIQSRLIERNNCAAGGTPGSVIYTVPAGSYDSYISQADADAKAQNEIYNNGQTYANANGICTFRNTVQSGLFTRNNCASGGTPGSAWYTVAAGIYSSTESQAAADAQAWVEIHANGQPNANSTAVCTFTNVLKMQSFTRNNCDAGGVPDTSTYVVPAGKYYSTESQEAADNQALYEISQYGQANANANASCTYYSAARSGPFSKNNCGVGTVIGSAVTYNQTAGVSYSLSSQADADEKGLLKFNTDGQAYANANGYCFYYNKVKSGSFTKNNCPSGFQTAGPTTYTVGANTLISYNSQAEADDFAQAMVNSNGQSYANANGSCNEIYFNATGIQEILLRKMFITLTASSSNHNGKSFHITIFYDTVNGGTSKTVDLALLSGETTKTFTVAVPALTYAEISF